MIEAHLHPELISMIKQQWAFIISYSGVILGILAWILRQLYKIKGTFITQKHCGDCVKNDLEARQKLVDKVTELCTIITGRETAHLHALSVLAQADLAQCRIMKDSGQNIDITRVETLAKSLDQRLMEVTKKK